MLIAFVLLGVEVILVVWNMICNAPFGVSAKILFSSQVAEFEF